MHTLLSTRVFANQLFNPEPWLLARRFGFTTVELFADGETLDIFDSIQVERIGVMAEAMGVHIPWIHLGPAVVDRLSDRGCLHSFGDTIRKFHLQVVTAGPRTPALSRIGVGWGVDDLRVEAMTSGARLVIDLERLDGEIVQGFPSGVGVTWDLGALDPADDDEVAAGVERFLGGNARGRLAGLRVAHRGERLREVPGEREARLLEQIWKVHVPATLIYDVDDPSGFGAEVELKDTLEELKDFHSGGKRPPSEGGGVFWAALAPG